MQSNCSFPRPTPPQSIATKKKKKERNKNKKQKKLITHNCIIYYVMFENIRSFNTSKMHFTFSFQEDQEFLGNPLLNEDGRSILTSSTFHIGFV